MENYIRIISLIAYVMLLYIAIFWLVTLVEKSSRITQKQKKQQEISSYPFVSIIIPAYNEEDTVEATITSVINLDYPKDCYEIIIIDDGSTDKTNQKIRNVIKEYSNVPFIFRTQENQGKAAALNVGLSQAKGTFFACLDADSVVETATLKKMILFYEEHKDKENLVILTPSMKVAKPETILQKFQRVEYILAMFIQRLMSHIDCMYIAPGPFSLYRTEIIRKIGGFDENNVTEDQEIAYRVQMYHLKIKQCPDAFVKTVAPRGVYEFYKQRNRWFRGSIFNLLKYKKLFFNKEYNDFGFFQLPLNLCSYLFSLLTFFFFAYFIIRPSIQVIHKLFLTNFDVITMLKQFLSHSFDILQLDLGVLFMIYTLFFITLYFFYVSHQFSNEKMLEEGIVYLFPYFIVYYILVSMIATIVLFQITIRRKQLW